MDENEFVRVWSAEVASSSTGEQLSPEVDAKSATQEAIPPTGQGRIRSRAGRPKRVVGAGVTATLVAFAGAVGAGSATLLAQHETAAGSGGIVRTVTSASPAALTSVGVPAILAKVEPAVVSVQASSTQANPYDPTGIGFAVSDSGTGVIITANGEILTNDHVIAGATTVTVTLAGGSTPIAATVVATDPSHDLALLKISGHTNLPTVTFGDSASVQVGDGVVAIGFALNLPGSPSVTSGIVSALNRPVSSQSSVGSAYSAGGMLQTDAPISSGNSGGPLVNSAGDVIGINTEVATSSRLGQANNIAFAIPSDTVVSLLKGMGTSLANSA